MLFGRQSGVSLPWKPGTRRVVTWGTHVPRLGWRRYDLKIEPLKLPVESANDSAEMFRARRMLR